MTILAIYLVGYVAAYFSLKYWFTREFDWTVGDRVFALLLAAFSWVGVLVALGCLCMNHLISSGNFNKKAKW